MKKRNLLSLFFAGALLTAITFSVNSCKEDEDPCEGITCQNGGSCNEGTCNCASGYEGSRCETESRARFLGTWRTTNEVCTSGGPSTFDITITGNNDILKVNIANAYGAGFTCVASISGNNLTIANQPFGSGTIQGSATVNGTSLNLSYQVTGSGATDNCNNVPFTRL